MEKATRELWEDRAIVLEDGPLQILAFARSKIALV